MIRRRADDNDDGGLSGKWGLGFTRAIDWLKLDSRDFFFLIVLWVPPSFAN